MAGSDTGMSRLLSCGQSPCWASFIQFLNLKKKILLITSMKHLESLLELLSSTFNTNGIQSSMKNTFSLLRGFRDVYNAKMATFKKGIIVTDSCQY